MSENNEIKKPLNKNNKVPKLRFPKFNDNWEENNLSSYSYIISGGTPDTTNQKYRNGEINWFTPTEIGIEKYVSESQRKITSLGLSKSSAKLIKANSILLTSRATIGAISINKKECTTNQGFQSLIPNGINLNYLYYLISTRKFHNKLLIHSSKSTFNEISHKEISKLKINVPVNKHEQEKIGLFFELIDNKIQIIKSKIDVLKKYKKGLENYAYKYVKKHGTKFAFRNLFSSINEKNNLLLKQYTVGKYGIKEMDKGKYDILKHRVFNPTNLIVGIGIEEIGISEHIKGSVSPIYDVFAIKNKSYYDSIRHTLKSQLWSKRNFITKNSTRREYEVDKKELLKVKIFACENRIFNSISNSIDLNQRNIELLEQKLNNLFEIKNYLLNNMFI